MKKEVNMPSDEEQFLKVGSFKDLYQNLSTNIKDQEMEPIVISDQIKSFNDFYNDVATSLKDNEKSQVLLDINPNISTSIKELFSQQAKSFNDFYNSVSHNLNTAEKRKLLLYLKCLARHFQDKQISTAKLGR